jgi:hypothetical protein
MKNNYKIFANEIANVENDFIGFDVDGTELLMSALLVRTLKP